MAVHLCLIVLIVVVFVVVVFTDANSLGRIPTNSDDFDNNKYISYADASFPRKELIKILQSRILKELNLSEDVLDHEDGTSDTSVPHLTDNAVRLLMHNEEKKELRKIVVQPLNYSNFLCLENKENNCSKFEFQINFEWHSIETIRVWFRKKQHTTQLSITVFFDGVPKVQYYNESDFDVIVEYGLIGFNVMKPSEEIMNDTIYCTIVTIGASVHETDEDGPFMVLTQNINPTNRNRRSFKSSSNPSDCGVVDRHVTAKELLMDKIVIYPPSINIKACKGKCKMYQSRFNVSYATAMYNMAKPNNSFSEFADEFWVPRCYPNKMSSIGVLYYDNFTRTYVESTMNSIVIESCKCLSNNCYSHPS